MVISCILNRLNSTSSALSSEGRIVLLLLIAIKQFYVSMKYRFYAINSWKVSVGGETRLSLLEEGLGGKISHLFPTTLRLFFLFCPLPKCVDKREREGVVILLFSYSTTLRCSRISSVVVVGTTKEQQKQQFTKLPISS